MKNSSYNFGRMLKLDALIGLGLAAGLMASAHAGTVVVSNTVAGTTPPVLGYNIGYYRDGSNAADWWRYSGIKAARAFLRGDEIEPSDDISGTGDGIKTKTDFINRKALLRANASNPAVALDSKYVNWTKFKTNIDKTGGNFAIGYTFASLRGLGVEILANITATESRFPLASNTEVTKMWELWQHYYATAFILGRDYDVRRYSMYNEPNLADNLTVAEWDLRLRVVSDAVRAAIADMNARYGKNLVPQILAPNTANPNYNQGPGDDWGHDAVSRRHIDMWGVTMAGSNMDLYNFQKYTHRQHEADGYSGFIEDCLETKALIAADMPGETPFPVGLTEWNTRTGASYDGMTNNADTPFDYAALGASAVALATECRAEQLYLFKFNMTAALTSGTTYPVAKNGTHYANYSSSGLNNTGGAAGTAEVWRLYNKASVGSRNFYSNTNPLGAEVWVQVTRDPAKGQTYVFIANKSAADVVAGVDLSAFGIADGSLVTLEEVSATARGAVKRVSALTSGQIADATMPATSVWLYTVQENARTTPVVLPATDDAALRDGTGKAIKSVNPVTLLARSDATANGRNVGLVKFDLPPDTLASSKRFLLKLNIAQTAVNAKPAQAHVYGVEYDAWASATSTFANQTTIFKQSIASGNKIANNVVNKQGITSKIQGQLVAASTTPGVIYVDVTDFVKAQTDGKASFLFAQEHRWDYNLDTKGSGDTQPTGIAINARLGAVPPVLLAY